jgi:enamine deaminase RidA (YjgF/YER057c/UK114 family)
VVGNTCWVAGTTDGGPDGRSLHPGDIGAQAAAVFTIIEGALSQAGFAMTDVVRIRMFVTDISRSAEVMAVQGAIFGEIRPAASLVEVSALIDPSLLIEIEADAVRG